MDWLRILAMCFVSVGWFTPAAFSQSDCGHPHGNYVVTNVHWEDDIGGLAVRTGAGGQAQRIGVIPREGTGVGVADCLSNGWCRVSYRCLTGWSFAAKYLALRSRQTYAVADVSANDPDGLNMRAGPNRNFMKTGALPYNAKNVVKHVCQDDTGWCLVTYRGQSGWVSGRFIAASVEQPDDDLRAPAPAPDRQTPPFDRGQAPGPSNPSPDANSKACILFPNLC